MTTLSTEEENYVRMSLLLSGVSPRAVRCKFDKEFAPAALPATIQKESHKLLGLKGRRVINQAQWNVLHPSIGIPDSKKFDVTLMICLLRNLTTITPPCLGFDCLPPSGETTEGADLARIKYYKNYLTHSDDTKIDNPHFTTAWKDVADVVGRLGGQSMLQECQELKVKILDQSNKEIMLEIKQSQEEMKHSKEEMKGLKQSFEGHQNKMKKEIETQKTCHKELKLSYDSLKTDNEEKSKEIEDLTKSYLRLKTGHYEKTKEVENLAKSYVSLKTEHDEKAKEVETLMKSYVSLKTDHDEKTKEIYKLKAAQEDVIPWNIRGQINSKLETWKKDDNMFVETRAAKRVLECVKTKSCVTVTGSSGMGKTFTVRHVTLQMAKDGYDILLVTSPKDIEKFYNPNKRAIFVLDNFCGTYTLNHNILDKWKVLSDTITGILEDKVTKIIVSCRSQVYQDDLFKSLPLFTSCECNLMSKALCLLPTERQSLAELYLKTDASKITEYVNLYECFLLLCTLYRENQNFDVTEFFKNPFSVYEAEIGKLWIERAYGKYCALVLCVVFNNHLKEEWLTGDIDRDMRTVIENICESCKLERGTSRLVIRDELESLSNTFIRKHMGYDLRDSSSSYSENDDDISSSDDEQTQSNVYCTICDKLFDYLVRYFGKMMILILIKNGDSRFIAERVLFEKHDDSDQFTIIVPDKYQQMLLQRMVDDWSRGHVSHIFNNINMNIQKFRDIFLNYLTNLKPLLQKNLAQLCDVSYNTADTSYHRYPWDECSNTTPLIQCCLVGDINMVQWFCVHGSDVNHSNSKGESPLHMASMKGYLEIITKLLDNNANVNQCTGGVSPLYIACRGGYTEVVAKFLDNKADVNKCTDEGESSLYIACEGGYTEIVTKLLDNKADVNKCTRRGVSPLYKACKEGYAEVVAKLLDNKADINKCSEKGVSPLCIACKGGYIEVVTKLLDNKADVNQCTYEGVSPLYIACLGRYTEIATKLLDNTADVNHCTRSGVTPLIKACKEGYTDVVTKLLDKKADVNQCTQWGESPLYKACRGGHIEVVAKLLDNKADVNQYTKTGVSPLYIACLRGYTEVVTKLLDNNADVNQCRDEGVSPLYIACEGGYTEVVTKLLDKKADVNQRTGKGESSLFVACKVWNKLLISNHSYIYLHAYNIRELEVRIKNKDRYSNTVKLLMNAGADYTLRSNDGKSALDLFQHQDIINMLLS